MPLATSHELTCPFCGCEITPVPEPPRLREERPARGARVKTRTRPMTTRVTKTPGPNDARRSRNRTAKSLTHVATLRNVSDYGALASTAFTIRYLSGASFERFSIVRIDPSGRYTTSPGESRVA
jgi:hypothetical protein